ncbi:hypothetical protein PG2072B_1021 [Bifidobacterium pseudolongum subsp. globosum]|uniref:Uncharacterized protein n=1 Tax=Bifidobacterium pseudolongum subsp. globosum TaxID=1690 RepID=A0A4Q5BCM9_9BIFI|nr:hypothetical protein [Bifidobacterium pseudolongum]RYQ68418.1 hypothetical protein PG2072B_1021 [Bifidobacterium pseudolongum subsp. globosum]
MTWNNNYQPQYQQPQQAYTPQEETAPAPSFGQLLKAGGGRAAFNKDSMPGATVTGTVTDIKTRQKKEYGTGKPMFSQKGNPKYEALITVQTSLQEAPDDDGRRTIYINMWGVQQDAIRKACEAAKCEGPVEGDTFTATYVGLGQAQPGMSAPKLYEYRIDHKPPVSFTQPTGGTQQAMPQQGTQQPQAHVDPMTVTQLRNAGKTDDEIARLLGVQPVDVMRIPGRAAAAAEPSEPEF